MSRLPDLPLLVYLIGAAGLAMLVPAAFALAAEDGAQAAIFGQWGALTLIGTTLLGVATARYDPRNVARSQLLSLLAAFALLPPLLALPLAQGPEALDFPAAWFEMVSAFTTTGATLLDDPAAVPDVVHLWRALVAWLGGFFVLLIAVAVLAPLNLGGMEVATGRPPGRAEFAGRGYARGTANADRVMIAARKMGPIYAGLTAVLWLGLLLLGEAPFVALCHAMAILSTSGISPLGGLESTASGRPGEALMFAFFVFAVTRYAFPGRAQPDQRRRLHRDPEFRLALALVLGLGAALFLLGWSGAAAQDQVTGFAAALRALWGIIFTLGAFLTTTGFVSGDWAHFVHWSGLPVPVLLLSGLALIGGGVATTAGGIKLLRVFALYRHGRHELERLVHPRLAGGGGSRARHLRGAGAYVAWIAFALFLLSLALVLALLALVVPEFDDALILAIAALTTTGQLANLMAEGGAVYSGLDDETRAILGAAMILGRLEMLAIVVLLVPESWRR